MSNVINFDDLKRKKELSNDIEDINDMSQYDFEKESNEFLEIFKQGEWQLVARNHIDATAISNIILNHDDNISHVEVVLCISRLNEFFKINPIPKDNRQIRLCSSGLAPSYLKHLQDTGAISISPDGTIIFNNRE